MGSIAQKLARLGETKLALRQAINDAGGSISADTPFRQYVDWIRKQGATLSLDFVREQYITRDVASMFPAAVGAGIITFTRASGGGRFNAQGQYEWLPANTPRIDYDPVTGECLGLLVEEQRTNLIPSSDTSAGNWVGGGDRVLGAATGLPGVFAVGASLARDASGNTFNYYQSLAPVAGTTYTFSVFVRFEDGRDVDAEFGQPGTENTALNPFAFVVNGGAFTWSTIQKKHVGGGLWRLSQTVTPSDTITRGWGILIRRAHKAGLPRLFVTGYQLEAGAFPTSLIHTEGAQVTRAADVASVNELSPWYNPEQGTLVASWSLIYPQAGVTNQHVAVFSDGGFMNYAGIRKQSGGDIVGRVLVANVVHAVMSVGMATSSVMRAAMRIKSDDFAISLDGAAPATDTSGTIPAVNKLDVGYLSAAGQYLNGHIRSIRYYPKRLSNTELQVLTA